MHHDSATEAFVGFYKKKTGKPSMTWSESVDQALCFGWIDGRGKSLGDESYMIRFTPRKPGSNWSKVNVAKIEELTRQGLMHPAGIEAFEARKEDRTGVYSFERDEPAELGEVFEAQFKAQEAAWEFFQTQAPWYRRSVTHWVVSAKREATRERRLATLIEDSASGRTVRHLSRQKKSGEV